VKSVVSGLAGFALASIDFAQAGKASRYKQRSLS